MSSMSTKERIRGDSGQMNDLVRIPALAFLSVPQYRPSEGNSWQRGLQQHHTRAVFVRMSDGTILSNPSKENSMV
jgi:hypothetical protein